MEKQKEKVGAKDRVTRVFDLLIWAIPQMKRIFDLIWDIARGGSMRKDK